MAVALDLHQLGDRDAARLADPTEVVASEIDEHHVLRALLHVGEQLLREDLVLVRVRSASARARDRPRLHRAVVDLDERLRRGTHDVRLTGVDEIEVGRRVDHAEDAIQIEGVDVGRHREPLAQHRLERVAGDDVLLDAGDRLDVGTVAHGRGHLGLRSCSTSLRRRDRWPPTRRFGQTFQHLRIRPIGSVVRGPQLGVIQPSGHDVGHDRHRLPEVIERDDVTREGQHSVREPEVVLDRLRQTLDLTHDVVAEVTDRTTVQRDVDERRSGERPKEHLDRVEETEVRAEPIRAVRQLTLDAHPPSSTAHDQEGIEPHEGVATPSLPVLRRLEQEARPVPAHPVVDTERSVEVGEDATRERDDAMLASERDERLPIRSDGDAHAGSATGLWKQLRSPV